MIGRGCWGEEGYQKIKENRLGSCLGVVWEVGVAGERVDIKRCIIKEKRLGMGFVWCWGEDGYQKKREVDMGVVW